MLGKNINTYENTSKCLPDTTLMSLSYKPSIMWSVICKKNPKNFSADHGHTKTGEKS